MSGPRASGPSMRSLPGLGVVAVVLALLVGLSACASDAPMASVPARPSLDAGAVARSEPMLDAIVERAMASSGTPGVAVGVVHDGEVVVAKGYGVREVGTDLAVDAETVFQLASVSKPLGSTAVAGVVGRGLMDWDQPIVDELPDFALSDPYVTAHVTVADMYSHRSGLPGAFAGNDLEQFGYDQAEIVERLRYLPLGPFRAEYSYSNFGLTIGGLAAAAAYGTSFAQMADEVLFMPAGMNSTSYSYADFAARENAARLHARFGGEQQARFTRDADAQAPAGGASSNVVDMNRWMLLQLDEGRLDGRQIIDAEALAETKRPYIRFHADSDPNEVAVESGLGWGVAPSLAVPSLLNWSHSGAFIHGAGTTVQLYPELGLGIVVLTNAQPRGVPEAIAEEYVDVLVHGRSTGDWAALYAEGMGSILAVSPVEVPATPRPARPLAAYVGTYANGYLGLVTVRRRDTGLELLLGPNGMTVQFFEPLDGDTFVGVGQPQIEGSKITISFEFTGEQSRASTLIIGSPATALPWWTIPRVG